jgi:hypothetical protein
MNCFVHDRVPAVGMCAVCQKAVCRDCIEHETPRLVCRTCASGSSVLGWEYKSAATFAGLPFVHICTGVNPVTMRPRVARGVVAIGNIAVGGLAIGGLSIGLLSVGGGAAGLLFALGGAAIGAGLSIGGFAVGSVAVGGAAVGFAYAIGGGAVGPAVIDGQRCDPAAAEFVRQWVGSSVLPPQCR